MDRRPGEYPDPPPYPEKVYVRLAKNEYCEDYTLNAESCLGDMLGCCDEDSVEVGVYQLAGKAKITRHFEVEELA